MMTIGLPAAKKGHANIVMTLINYGAAVDLGRNEELP